MSVTSEDCEGPHSAIIQWESDNSFSVIHCTAIQSGIEAVGESVVALYGKKSYTGAIVELGKLNAVLKNTLA